MTPIYTDGKQLFDSVPMGFMPVIPRCYKRVGIPGTVMANGRKQLSPPAVLVQPVEVVMERIEADKAASVWSETLEILNIDPKGGAN